MTLSNPLRMTQSSLYLLAPQRRLQRWARRQNVLGVLKLVGHVRQLVR